MNVSFLYVNQMLCQEVIGPFVSEDVIDLLMWSIFLLHPYRPKREQATPLLGF